MDKRDKSIMLSIITENIRKEDMGIVYDGGDPVEISMETTIIDEDKVLLTTDEKGRKKYSTSLANIGIEVTIK